MGTADLLPERLRARRRALIAEMRAVPLHTAAGRGRFDLLAAEVRALDDRIRAALIDEGAWRGWDRGYRLVLVPGSFRGG